MQGKSHIKLIMSFLFLMASQVLFGQEDIHIYGTVKEVETNHKMESVIVQVTQDGKSFDSYTTSGSSKFEFDLPLGHLYNIKFSKDGYIGKKIEINTKYIPEEDQEGGFKLDLDMSLFEYIEGFDESILEEPIGIAAYDAGRNSIEFDFDYTRQIMNKVEAEKIRLQNLAEAEKEKRKRFDELMIQGSDELTKEKYEDAVSTYTSALDLFPDEEKAQVQLAEAERLLALQNKDAELEAQYQAAIKEGNSLMKDKDYEASMSKFQEAQSLKPEEREPKDKIRELEELIAAAGDQAKFDEYIAAGDSDMSSEEYQSALDNYKAARDIIPGDKDVKKKIDEAQAKLDEMLAAADAEAAKQKRYDDLIAKADGSYNGEDYELSITQYEQALEIFPSESYPQNQIEEARKRIEELAQEALANEAADAENKIQQEYDAALEKANSLFVSEELNEAKTAYEDALAILPDEKFPKQRINRIEELLKEKELAAEAEKAASAEAEAEKERLAELERQRLLEEEAAEAERLRLEEELAEQQRLLEEERRRKEEEEANRRNLASNIDTQAERQAEEFYKQQKLDENEAKLDAMQVYKDEHQQWLQHKASNSLEDSKAASSEIQTAKNEIQRLYAEGEIYHKDKRENFDSGAKKIREANEDYALNATDRRVEDDYKLREVKENIREFNQTKNDRSLNENTEDFNQAKKELDKANRSYQETGEVLRKDNEYEVTRAKEEIESMKKDGTQRRMEAQAKNDQIQKDRKEFIEENTYLQDERIMVNSERLEQTKENRKEELTELDQRRKSTQGEMADVKEDIQKFNQNRAAQESVQRKIKREEIHAVDNGGVKAYEDYHAQEGTEDLAEGVTERSFELNQGRKLVIERTVKLGNKIDTYSKVIDKHATYYFKNNSSITKSTWERETLSLAD